MVLSAARANLDRVLLHLVPEATKDRRFAICLEQLCSQSHQLSKRSTEGLMSEHYWIDSFSETPTAI